jgi:hypothetical protein
VNRDSAKAIKKTGYRVFIGLAEGTFRVLSDPSEYKKRGKETPAGPYPWLLGLRRVGLL